jgi:hypothetical protein
MPHLPKRDGILAVFSIEKTYRLARAGDLGAGSVHKFYFFQKALCTGPFPTFADRTAGPCGPLPCQAWHGV